MRNLINSNIPNVDIRFVAFGLYLLSFLYENIFPFERDINSYRALLWGTNTLNLKGYFPPMLENIGLFLRNIHPFYLNLMITFLSLFVIYKIIDSLKRYLSFPLILILVGNPLTLSWFIFPAKECFIILIILLVSQKEYSYFSILRSFSLILAFILSLIIRPWILPFVAASFIISSYEEIKILKLIKKRLIVFAFLVFFILFYFYFLPNIGSYISIARNASNWLTNYGAKDMFVFQFGNIFLDSILNIIPLTFFSITSSSSSKIIFLVLNFISLRLIWNISNFGFKYKNEALLIFLLYILPYTLTIINSGGALRVILTGVFSSAIIINQKYINILNKRKGIIATN